MENSKNRLGRADVDALVKCDDKTRDAASLVAASRRNVVSV